ncbi:diguanylate cyclase domain-containing protein [Paenibacillus assamensis]|uniref:diguanylate cyclase domain-containing protein n=1 Tax=Paenibacillus assamensis TaxID=311244 RepID=UPI00040FBF44|nr:diguanylate cyclase [Paenibacillus assamensis]
MPDMKDPLATILKLPPTRKQTVIATVVGLLIIGLSMSVLPYAQNHFLEVNAFYPLFIAWVLIGDFVTSHLFYIQYRASGEKPLLILSATFLFTALIVIPHAAAFPGILPYQWVGNLEQLSLWLWLVWHIGYPIGIIKYSLHLKSENSSQPLKMGREKWLRGGMLLGTGAIVVIVTYLLYSYRAALPAFLNGHNYEKLVYSGIGPAVAVLNVIAFTMLLLRTKFNSVLHIWLTLSVFTFCLDVILTLYAGERYSVGWYVARFNALLSATAALAVLFFEVNQLYIRLTRSQAQLKQSQTHLNNTLNSLSDCFVALSNEWKYMFVNKSAEQFEGISFQEVKGKHFWVFNTHLLDTQWYEHSMRTMTEKVRTEFLWFDEPKQRWLETRMYPTEEGVSIFYRDVTLRIVSEQRMKEANEKLQMANRLLKDFSFRDGLTGVYNRRYFDQVLQQEWQSSGEAGTPLTLMLFDLDYFKLYNDTYGHQQGDECLTSVAHAVRDALSDSNAIVARYGGEEFAIILPHTDKMQAAVIAEAVRLTVEHLGIVHGVPPAFSVVTCSLGSFTMQVQSDQEGQESSLIQLADQAMYEAKQAGRNQVRIHG